MFEAYITNTALYPLMGIEGRDNGTFPHDDTGVAGRPCQNRDRRKRYSEVFFTSFDSDVLGLYDHLYECENIDELNELGHACWKYGIRADWKPLKPLLSWETTHGA